MKWISVEDQLPQQQTLCLLYITYPPETFFHCRADPLPRNFTVIGGLRYDGIFISYNDQYSECGIPYVTHWMPLPEPPNDN
jgi:hypothetical protein